MTQQNDTQTPARPSYMIAYAAYTSLRWLTT